MSDIGLGLDLSGLGQEPLAPAVDVTQLTDSIRLILKDADLEQLSRRMIRKQLEAQFHTDLSNYKDVINATILEIIEQQQAEEEDDDEEEEQEPDPSDEDADADDEQERTPRKKAAPKKKATPKKRKRKTDGEEGKKSRGGGGFNAELSLSPELAQVVGAETMARPQVVKALWAYIREHDLQDPNNKKTILLDDTLRNVFQRDSFTMFSMNKFVKRHVRKPDDLPPGGWSQIPRDGVSSDEDTEAKAKKKPVKRKKKASSTEDGDEGKKKKNNPFNTELSVSPELGSLIGSDRMARPQIVKALWAYIHEHDLQDPGDKRTILLDDRMKQVFQRDSFTMFSMNKFIKRHARKFDALPPGGWAEIPRDGLSSDEDEAKTKKKAKKSK
ncbi:Upstream activation factor subunit spp27 [Phytophthora citrophthora]|uniref:Upstream activation factor subunit spp27 n=1 Tax=Phytophthora citrophthora TaxID=4793 RepID=A0AAD9GZ36_9STRA|nr:Upstream activation factor subunit spp27 [Phytophthora citrophthora]